MIYGITHDNDGRAIQRLSVSTKIAVGLPPDPSKGRKAPMKLDHFLFLRKTNAGSGLNATWEIDPELTKHFEKKTGSKTPREIEIILLNDELEDVFPTQLAWWSATKCVCHGNGEQATRRTEAAPDGEPWVPCGRECPDLQAARCKPSGDLRFMLADFPRLGAICRIHTTSYRSVMQVQSAIQQVQTITGGRLAGIRAMLCVKAEKTSYAGNDGKRHSTVVPILSLEIKADGIQKLIGGMVETARLFEQTRKLLGGQVMKIEDDDEQKVAGELGPEFYETDAEEPEKATSRRERERGTLEPSREPNRGHGNENLGRQARAKPKAAAAPKPAPAAEPVVESQPEDPMNATCQSCSVPHPRSQHEGLEGLGSCMDCDCPGFSDEPPKAAFDTVFANVAKEGERPKFEELPRVVGKIVEFQNTNSKGERLISKQTKSAYVIVKLHGPPDAQGEDPHRTFFCFHGSMLDALGMALGERATLVYTKEVRSKDGAPVVWQMIHDIMQVGDQSFPAGMRKTVGSDPMSQEATFSAEDENQDAGF